MNNKTPLVLSVTFVCLFLHAIGCTPKYKKQQPIADRGQPSETETKFIKNDSINSNGASAGNPIGNPVTRKRPGSKTSSNLAVTRNPSIKVLFNEIYLAGPQQFVAKVKVHPVMKAGQFLGYAIENFPSNELAYQNWNLQRDDIILSVNGLSLETPADFMNAWASLKKAKSLQIEYIRNGQTKKESWSIQ
jgi:type II secretory pathway component PulC